MVTMTLQVPDDLARRIQPRDGILAAIEVPVKRTPT